MASAGAGDIDPTVVRAEIVARTARKTWRRMGETPRLLSIFTPRKRRLLEESTTIQSAAQSRTLLGALTSGASELSKPRSRTGGELKQNAEHPPKTDPNIPNDRWILVKHDHINRHERCNGGEECAGGAR